MKDKFEIGPEIFNVMWTTDADGKKILILRDGNQSQNKGFILQSLFSGKSITVEIGNAAFISKIAEKFKLDDLLEICKIYTMDGSLPPGGKSAFLNTMVWIRSLLRHFGTITKFFFTLWDLIGVAFVLGFFCNVIILIATTGLSTIEINPALFVFVILPFILFSIYFVNLMIIAVLEFFKFRVFIIKSPFSSTQILFSKFLKVIGSMNIEHAEYYDFGYVYDVTMGLLLIVFVLLFGLQMFSTNAAFLVELFVYIFAVILPPLRYVIVIILYAVHAFLGCSKRCSSRFIEIGDFSDFILNAIYFRDHEYHDMYDAIKGNIDVRSEIQSDDHNETTGGIPLEDVGEVGNSTVIDYLTPVKGDIDGMSKMSIILRGIFSKHTFAIYVFVSVLIYVIYNAATSNVTVAQVVVLLLVFGAIIVPMATWISFPFFWIERAKEQTRTERSLERERESLSYTLSYKRYVRNYMIWSHDAVILRWSSIILSFIVIFFLFLYILVAIVFASNPNVFRADEIEYNESSMTRQILEEPVRTNETEGFRMTRNPICDYSLKGLNSQQLLALADASYYNTPQRKQKKELILREYFNGSLTITEINTTKFPDPIYNCSLSHFEIEELNLIVFSIKGTKTLNDIIADAELWIGSMIFDVVMQFTPLVEMYAATSRVFLGWLLSLPRYVFKQFSLVEKYVSKYYDYINSIEIPENYDVILTGHSLGGGIAKILSLMTGWQAVAVSGPGISSVESTYKSKFNNIGNTFVNINPAHDMVAMIDSISDSTEFKIPCRSGIMKCHSSVRTLCQTGIICGDGPKHEQYCRQGFPGTQYDEMAELITLVDKKVK
jgi:lipase ATG15